MAKNSFLDWSTTADDNTDIGGISIAGTAPPSNLDNGVRGIMAQLRSGVDPKAVYAVKTGNYTALATDYAAIHRYIAVATVSLTAAATLAADWRYTIIADGGAVTIDPSGSETINGLATMIVPDGTTAEIICDGASFFTVIRPSGWQTIERRVFSGSSGENFTNLAGYKDLRLRGRVNFSSPADLAWRESINNGSSFSSGASDYAYQILSAVNTSLNGARLTAAYATIGTSADIMVFDLYIHDFGTASNACGISHVTALTTSFSNIYIQQLGQITAANSARNAIRILPTSAVTMTGEIVIEGCR